jgi:hypothetical protein
LPWSEIPLMTPRDLTWRRRSQILKNALASMSRAAVSRSTWQDCSAKRYALLQKKAYPVLCTLDELLGIFPNGATRNEGTIFSCLVTSHPSTKVTVCITLLSSRGREPPRGCLAFFIIEGNITADDFPKIAR